MAPHTFKLIVKRLVIPVLQIRVHNAKLFLLFLDQKYVVGNEMDIFDERFF